MCEYCKPNKQALSKPGHPHEFIIDDGAIFYYDSLDGWEGEKINYCPYCNQRLTPEEPLTVEELKEMDGEPVWVKSIWMLSVDSQDYIDYVKVSGDRLYRHKPIEE